MRPEFGCRIHDHVFGPANAATAGQIAYDVREALERWEPRIDITDVQVSFDRDRAPARSTSTSATRSAGCNDPRNLVFPFYVIPDEETRAGQRSDRRPGSAASARRTAGAARRDPSHAVILGDRPTGGH